MSKLSLYDLVGDLVLYRNLDPVDARLPQFADAWAEIGLPERDAAAQARGELRPNHRLVSAPGTRAGQAWARTG